MDAQHSSRRPWAPPRHGAPTRPGRTLVLAGAILVTLVLGDILVAHGTTAAADPVTLIAATATPHRAHPTPPRPRPTVTPIATTPTLWRAPGAANTSGTIVTPPPVATPTHKPTHHASGTPTTAATPDEAHTPINLSDPLGSGASVGADAPWWQSALDVAWKLALVVGLIYLALRALAALKRRGFGLGAVISPSLSARMGRGPGGGAPRLLEPLEEVQLAPNHVLHAVRVGDRVFLIARTNGALRALGEAEMGEGVSDENAPALPAAGFAGQLLRAWSGLMPQSSVAETPPAALPNGDAPTAPSADAVIDAKWSITPDVAPDPASDAAPLLPELPLRQGDARSGDEPPPLSASEERDILWFAEEHGDSAAAKKFGLTRQRVTAMRVRYDRERAEHPPRRTKSAAAARSATMAREAATAALLAQAQPDVVVTAPAALATAPAPVRPTAASASTASRRPAAPDHPRGAPGAEPSLPAVARTSQARAAYRQATTPVKPDVASTLAAAAETEEGAVTVGQILAARFGIKIPQTT